MSDDIVERLRKRSVVDTQLHRRWRSAQLMSQAADEIERLRIEAEMSTKRESALRKLANGRLDEIERLRSELERRRRAIARLNWVGDD